MELGFGRGDKMTMTHDKLTLEDNLTLEKVKKYLEEWDELLPSFQLVLVKWLIVELNNTQEKLNFAIKMIAYHVPEDAQGEILKELKDKFLY